MFFFLALIFCLVILKLKTVSLIWAYLGAAVGTSIFSTIYIKRYIFMCFKLKWIKEIVHRGFPTIPLNLFEVISNSIGRLFVERWVGLASLGIYSHSLDYRKAFMLPHRAFQKSFGPEIIEAVSTENSFKYEKMKRILKNWFGVLMVSGTFVILFSRDIINILTHGKFVDAALIVSIWFILMVIFAFGAAYTPFILANKKTKFIFFSDIIIGAVSWPIMALSVKYFGVIGAAVSVCLYFFMLHFARRIYARRLGCINYDGRNFVITIVSLIGLLLFVNTVAVSFLAKILITLVISFISIKYYEIDLSVLKVMKKNNSETF